MTKGEAGRQLMFGNRHLHFSCIVSQVTCGIEHSCAAAGIA